MELRTSDQIHAEGILSSHWEGYYIHRHQRNIGVMTGEGRLNDAALAKKFEVFKNYDKSKKSPLDNTVKKQYLELLRSSMDTANNPILNEVFDIKNNNIDSILDRLNQGLQKGFEEQFTNNKITALLQNEAKDDWKGKSGVTEGKSVESITKLLRGEKTDEGFKYFNSILQNMADTVKLLESEEGEVLAGLLLNIKNNSKNFSSTKELGEALQSRITQFQRIVDKKTITGRDAAQVAENLNKVANRLAINKNSKGKPLSAASLQGVVQNNFYALTAEVFASHISQAGQNSCVKYITDTVKDINLIGDESVPIEVTLPNGQYTDSVFKDSLGKDDNNFGKADLKFENVLVDLSLIDKAETGGEFKMSVGLSNKAYVTNKIGAGSLHEIGDDHFSLGGGMTLGNAFSLIFGQGQSSRYRYYGYNILGKGANKSSFTQDDGKRYYNQGLPKALNTLQDVLLTRSILYLVAGRGKADFASFMFLNGKLLSVWDIIKYALNNNIGKSSSQQKTGKTGLYMSIPARETFQKYSNSKFLNVRVDDTNRTIERAVMKGTIVPSIVIKNTDTSKVPSPI